MKTMEFVFVCILVLFNASYSLAITDPQLPAETSDTPQQSDVSEEAMSQEELEYMTWAKEMWDSLDRQTGDITLANGVAILHVPESFYYLNPADAERVLTEVWGNPPGQDVLGMLFPAGSTPFDSGSWAVTIEYEQDGYVKDDEADSINYSKLLKQMQKDTREASEYRVEQGYEPIELIGWAAQPYYDKASHKMHWAKEIKFGNDEITTLNYNIRVLGRKGVLVLNFIAGMDQLEQINGEVNQVLAMAEFNEGSRYADFDPSIDQVAAYGLGALVTGKVLAKTGLLAALFIFLKKFGIFIVIAIGALIGKLFKRS